MPGRTAACFYAGYILKPTTSLAERLKTHFLAHQQWWAPGLLLLWGVLNVLLLASSTLMEARRFGGELETWKAFCWEASSTFVMLLCIWPVIRLHRWLQSRLLWPQLVVVHALLTVPFSLVHVAGMVMVRKLVYGLMGEHYQFGNVLYEFLYEYRKDAMAYLLVLVAVSGYQFILRRLQGEASYVDESESSSKPLPDRLLVKKLGKEFLVAVADIRWVEASGNYANLHVKDSVYPMRITMARLEALLPSGAFVRVHRSFIVNLGHVSHIQPTDAGDYQLFLNSGEALSLSRRYRDSFKAAMAESG